jgi:hypothetical protein
MGILDNYDKDLWDNHGDGRVDAHVGKYDTDFAKRLHERIARIKAEADKETKPTART